jgi:radical SAM protein with 4Fe4S-binding SPASM domain
MSYDEIKETIEEIDDAINSWQKNYNLDFARSVNITGGEPFLRKDLFEIINEFDNSGFDTYLLTNGILINNSKAEKLKHHNVKGVQVSIEGPEKIHDSIRGRNSFSASLRGVKSLLDADLKVTLNVTISNLNADYLKDITRLASDVGVNRLGFSRLVPSGRGLTMIKEMLNKDAVMALYNDVFSYDHLNDLEIVTGDPVASQFRNNSVMTDCGNVAMGGCAAGISGLTIMPDGTLLPCRRLPVPIGNVRKDSIREIWATSDVLNDLRDRSKYKGKCGTCDKWANCRGCRAIAYAYTEAKGRADMMAPDPQCFL